jgi:hydroxypyruvate isomerase
MNLGSLIDEESIWMSFWRRGQNNQRVREDLVRRQRNRLDEDDEDERERVAVAEDHARIMKNAQIHQHAVQRQAVADQQAQQQALRAWRAGSDDRRER